MTMRNRTPEAEPTEAPAVPYKWRDPGNLPEWVRPKFVEWAIVNGCTTTEAVDEAVGAWQAALAATAAYMPTICGSLLPGTEATPGQRIFHPSPALITHAWLEAWCDFVHDHPVPEFELNDRLCGGYTTRTACWVIEESVGLDGKTPERTTLRVGFPVDLAANPFSATCIEYWEEAEVSEGVWQMKNQAGFGVGYRNRDDVLVLLEVLGRGHHG